VGSVEKATDDRLEDDEDPGIHDDELEEPDLDAPLELLNSVTARLLRGEIPTNQTRLNSLFEHIQSVVGDVVDAGFAKITHALDQVEIANEALLEDAEDSPEARAFIEEFETSREHIEEGLAIMQETFFSAQNLDQLEEFEEEFREAEVQLAEGLGRLEAVITQVENPDLFGVHEEAASEHVGEALEAFASGLDALNAHLEDGKPDHLEFVLEQIELAREYVENALVQIEERTEVEDIDDIEEEASDEVAG
jgi:hypothetical protein